MSCDSFESCVVDLARGDELAEGVRDQALSHAEGCLRCAARLEDERSVTGALRAFAARTATAEAPPWVETALIREMRAPEAGSAGREIAKPSRAVELLLLVAAAAILAAIVVVPPRFDRFSGGTRPAATVGSPAARSGSPGVAADENADFVALTYGDDLGELESLQVVSVELPRTALTALGWPAGEGAPDESVRADVIVGYDGVARAIRFVD